jgi:trigger factor
MNVTETKSEGLSREFRVSIPKGDLNAKFNAKITELQPKMNLKGFRPGKVPAAHIKKMYGKSIMGMMMLAAERGTELELEAAGPDADAMLRALGDLVAAGFGEE